MHASTEAATILYLTQQPLGEPELDVETTTVGAPSDPAAVHQHLSDTVQCLLIGDDIDTELTLALVGEIDTVPVLVFAGNRDEQFVEHLFEAGASDVLQSTPAATPSALLRRRIEAAGDAKTASRERRSLLERYETLLDTAADAIYQVDTDGRIVEINEATTELTGYSREELLGAYISEFIDEESLRESERLREAQLSGEADEVTSLLVRFTSKSDETVPCRARISVLREDGEVVGWVGVARDVREQREREAELQRTRELLSNAERLGDVGVWELDPVSDQLFWSDGARRIRGATEDLEPTPENVLDFYHAEDRDRISALVERCQKTGEGFSTRARIITTEGEKRWVHLQGERIDAEDSSCTVRGYIQDITERTEREQELQAERDLIEQILEINPVGIVSIATDGTVVRVNAQASSILGIEEESLENSHYTQVPIQLFTPDGETIAPEEQPVRRILEDGELVTDEELMIERPDGQHRIIAVDGVPLVDDGEIRQAILTFDDVTVDVERETRLTEQRNELAQLDHINRIIRGVDQALLAANSREDIMQAVCERLSESSRYRFALTARLAADGRFELETWAGPGEEYIDAAFPIDNRRDKSYPGLQAIETGEIQAIENITERVSDHSGTWEEIALDAGVRSVVAIPVVYEEQTYGVVSVFAPYTGSFTDRELDVLEELGETVGYAIAAVKRREREEILTSLYETTQDLLAAETEQAVTDTVVDAANEVLDVPGVGIFLFDDEENVLAPASATDELLEFYGDATAFGPGRDDSEAWQTYATGETRFFPDIRESEHLANPETAARSTLLIPLGDHGVFVVSATERGVFGEEKRRLIGLLAATTEAALDRVAGRADIRQRDRELKARAERVDRLEHTLSLVRGTVELLGEASTRPEFETGVCEQLAAPESHAFAWIGYIPPDGYTVAPQTWAGDEEGYLDAVFLGFENDEPAVRAAKTGEIVIVPDVTDELQTSDWARHAADRDIQSVAAVPLTHGETTYGVLSVYATAPDAFDDLVESVLDQLSRTIAYGINAIETSQGVLAEKLTELELEIDTPGTFLNAVADVAGQPVGYREITPQPGDSARVLFALEGASVEDILALDAEFVSVESLTHVEHGDEQLFRATLSGQTVAATLLDCGAIPRRVVATADQTRAVVRLSREIDVRVFLDRVRQQYPATELVSRKDVERTQPEEGGFQSILDEELTARQREVLLTAFESGFFESPRETTGEQLAGLLDLSQPTVTHHLREAQRRLFTALLEE